MEVEQQRASAAHESVSQRIDDPGERAGTACDVPFAVLEAGALPRPPLQGAHWIGSRQIVFRVVLEGIVFHRQREPGGCEIDPGDSAHHLADEGAGGRLVEPFKARVDQLRGADITGRDDGRRSAERVLQGRQELRAVLSNAAERQQ